MPERIDELINLTKGDKIKAQDLIDLKNLLNEEIKRRCYNRDISSYAKTEYSPEVEKPLNPKAVLNELLTPIKQINENDFSSIDTSKIKKENLAQYYSLIASKLKTYQSYTGVQIKDAEHGCSGQCTGFCSTSCEGGCDSSCAGGCSSCTGCGSGCASGCSGSCKGGCTGCGSGCRSNCGSKCVGGCSSDCGSGCADECTIICQYTCTGTTAGQGCSGCSNSCVGTCYGTCFSQVAKP